MISHNAKGAGYGGSSETKWKVYEKSSMETQNLPIPKQKVS